MSSESEIARQNLDLDYLSTTLRNAGIANHFTPKSEEYALPFLSILLPAEGEDNQQPALQLTYIPTAEMLDESNLLQFFAYLPPPVETARPISSAVINYVNSRTACGYWAIDEAGNIYHRYVYCLPRFVPPGEKVFLEILDLFAHSYSAIGDLLIKFSKRELTEVELKAAI